MPWRAICREQSPRILRISATVASIGSPRMRTQFLVVPHVMSCCGTRTVAAIGAGNGVSSDVICPDVISCTSVGDALGSRLLLRTYATTKHAVNLTTAWSVSAAPSYLELNKKHRIDYNKLWCESTTNPVPVLRIAAARGFSELTKNVMRSSYGHSTPSLKISCKSVYPFSRNLDNKETKKDINN